jgi:hypothetical protein
MGRKIRRVPKGWEPPPDVRRVQRFQPQYDLSYREAAEKWVAGFLDFERRKAAGNPEPEGCGCAYFWEYDGPRPKRITTAPIGRWSR